MATCDSIVELGWKLWSDAAAVLVFAGLDINVSNDTTQAQAVWVIAKTRHGEIMDRVDAANVDELHSHAAPSEPPVGEFRTTSFITSNHICSRSF